jgi:MFS family permease
MSKAVYTALFISLFATMLGVGIVAPLMAIYAESFGATGFMLGVVFSAFSIARTLFSTPAGKLGDSIGKKPLLLTGLAMYSLLSIAYAYAPSLEALIAVRMLHGLSSALVAPVALAYVGDIAPRGEEGRYMGTFLISFFMGFGLGPLIGGVLEDTLGIRAAFTAMGLLSLFALFMTMVSVPNARGAIKKDGGVRKALKSKVVVGGVIFRMSNSIGIGAVMVFLPLYIVHSGLNESQAGILLSANILVSALFQRKFGAVADRSDPFILVLAGSLMYGLGIAFIPFFKDFLELLLLSFLMGMGSALSVSAAMAVIAREGRKYGMGSVMGVFDSAMGIGFILGPITLGIVFDAMGTLSGFVTAGLINFAGSAIFFGASRLHE